MTDSLDSLPNFNAIVPDQKKPSFNIFVIVSMVIIGLGIGLFLGNNSAAKQEITSKKEAGETAQTTLENTTINSKEQIEVGKTYGSNSKIFTDKATGVVEQGSINGVGTHILVREGGLSQRASLTSSTLDLDLFVGKKVEIKGQTNNTNKTGWLLDVGSIKVLE